MNLMGKTIANRYEILEKTGVGGMATVYVARDLILNRKVAIKVLKEEFTTDEEFVRRFNTEAQAAASLSHPNIVSIYDVGNEENIYYIVMELIRGKTLKQIITEEGALSWKWAVNIAMQIASALEVAHRNGIVHRDIKPHNIIITEEGVAKVTDFGIAKAVSNSTITAFGTTIGSVHYFSPEQAKGGYTDAKSDIYSLGIVLYEMLTGKVPFDADTSVSVALKHMQEEPIPPKDLNPQIPSAVNAIILKSMQKEPMARYQTAAAMLVDLDKSLKDPEGDFVGEDAEVEDSARLVNSTTRKTAEENNRKEKGKIKKFLKDHPFAKVVLVFLICIILFVGSIGITSLVMNVSNPKEVEMPNLVNLSEEEAKAKLEEVKLIYNKVNEVYNSEIEAGRIISQEPEYRENYKIKEKSTISVIVSKGTETTIVPKVIGKTFDEAVKELEEAKLVAEKIEENSKTVEAGIVISQETVADTTANAGDTVKIHVSTGAAQATVPKVIGKTEEEAKKILTESKLKVVVEQSSDTSKENGVVISQSINEGKEVDEDTSITITVNKFEETKEAKIDVNVKSITGGYKVSENTVEEKEKKAKVKITVDGDTVYNKDVDLNATSITPQTISGKGTVTVKVYIDDVLKRTKDITLSSTPSYVFE